VLSPGQILLTQNVGIIPLSKIYGNVWLDLNFNGIPETGEWSVSRRIVYLMSSPLSGSNLMTVYNYMITDQSGIYSFTQLPPANYQLQVQLPDTTWTFSPVPTSSSLSTANKFAAISSGSLTGTSVKFSFTSSSQAVTANLGTFLYNTISGFVWYDQNPNGIKDSGELVAKDIPVTLYTNGAPVSTNITASDGSYSFGTVSPGNHYVKFTAPNGYVFSPAHRGIRKSEISSVVDNNGNSEVITVPKSGNTYTLGAGLYQKTSKSKEQIGANYNQCA
jgi:hypothetical protein